MNAFRDSYRATLRRVFTDKGAVLLMVGAIVIYSMFYPLPYLTQAVTDAPVAIVDLDQSSLSRQFARWADAHQALKTTPYRQTADARAAILDGTVDGYLVIPSGFRADLLAGSSPTVLYGGDASRFLVLKQILTGFTEVAGTLSASVETRRLLASGQAREQAAVARSPLTINLHPLFNTREGYGTYLIPAVFVLILQQTLLLGLGLLIGTARQDQALPLPTERPGIAPFLGNCSALVTLYAAHAVFFFGFCFWLFDIPQRAAPVALAAFLLPFLLACTLFAYTLGGLCRRRESSLQGLLFTSIPFLFLAGFAWPLELMPPPLPWLAHLIPSTAGIQGFLRLNQMGASLAEVRHWWFTLWALCLLYAWPAYHIYRVSQPHSRGE